MSCNRPFDPGIAANQNKRLACEQFKALFSGTCVAPASTGHCITPSNEPRPKVGRSPSISSLSCNKLKKNRYPTKVFDQNRVLTVGITDKIKGGLHGRNYLAENEIKLIHVF